MGAVSLLHPTVVAFAGVVFIVSAGVVAYIQAYPERCPWIVRGY